MTDQDSPWEPFPAQSNRHKWSFSVYRDQTMIRLSAATIRQLGGSNHVLIFVDRANKRVAFRSGEGQEGAPHAHTIMSSNKLTVAPVLIKELGLRPGIYPLTLDGDMLVGDYTQEPLPFPMDAARRKKPLD